MFFKALIGYLPEVYLFTSLCIILHFGTLYFTEFTNFFNSKNSSLFLSVCTISNSLILLLVCINNNLINIRTGHTIIIEILILFIILLIFIGSHHYNFINNIPEFEYSIFLILSILSLFFLLNSNDLILFYLLIELQGIAFYILTSLKKKSKYSIEAGLKYFILGSISSIILLFGISILYAFTGLLSFQEIFLFTKNLFILNNSNNSMIQSILSISILFILIGFLFKIYCAPFHY